MTRMVYVYSTPDSARYVLVRGHVGQWLQARGIPALRTPMHGGYWVRHERASQVLAELDVDGCIARWVDGTAPPHEPRGGSSSMIAFQKVVTPQSRAQAAPG